MNTRVLIVCNQIGILKKLRQWLKDFSLASASSGQEALWRVDFEKGFEAAVIYDNGIPDMSAPELIKKLHVIDPDLVFVYLTDKDKHSGVIERLEVYGLEVYQSWDPHEVALGGVFGWAKIRQEKLAKRVQAGN